MKHSFIVPLLLVDWLLGKIVIEYRHVWGTIFYLLCYLSLMYSYSSNVKQIYKISGTFDEPGNWAFIFIVMIFGIASHMFFSTVSKWRHQNSSSTTASAALAKLGEHDLILVVLP